MSLSSAPVPLETLLTHRDAVRRLARSLVRDEFTADDVEQQTWVAALRRPPQQEGTVRAWLGRVVRNLASDTRRAERRRAAHERTAAVPEALRSTADVVGESEAHLRVVAAVHRLAEPSRTTVLLRWFEDLPPRSIADRMAVPVETVRTRLRRAQESLRADLGRAAGAERDWLGALGPLVGLRAETAGACGATAAKAASLGGVVVGTKTGVAIAVGVAVAGSFLGGTIVNNRGDRTARIEADSEVAELRTRLEALETTRGGPSELRSPAGEDRRVAELEARLATQSGRLDAIEAAVKTASHDPVPTSAAGPRAADAASAVRDAELQRRRGLTDDALFAELGEMMTAPTRGGKTDGRAVLDVCEVLLARALEPAKRAQALTYKGIGHRLLLDRTSEEAAFRDAIATAVPGSKDAIEAAYQLAWTVARGGDHRGAAELFLGIASNSSATPLQRASNRLSAAKQFEAAGDKERATAEYRGVVTDFGNAEDGVVRRFAEDARLALERLAKAPPPGR